jgi:hypothetical protein
VILTGSCFSLGVLISTRQIPTDQANDSDIEIQIRLTPEKPFEKDLDQHVRLNQYRKYATLQLITLTHLVRLLNH